MARSQSVNFRLAVDNANQAIRELERFGSKGERAIERIGKATGPVDKRLRRMNAVVGTGRKSLEGFASSAALVPGPLGRIGAQASGAAATVGRLGAVGTTAAVGLAALTAALGAGTREAAKFERLQFRLAAVLKATGNTAGLTVAELDAFATELGAATLTSREAALEAIATLSTFRRVAPENFKPAIELSQDLAAVFKTDLLNATKQIGKALEDPREGLTQLRRVGVIFTAEQQELIKSLVDTGQAAEAQRLILAELEKQVGGAGRAEARGLSGAVDTLGERWTNLLAAFGATDTAASGINFLSEALNGFRILIEPTAEEAKALGEILQDLSFGVLGGGQVEEASTRIREQSAASRFRDNLAGPTATAGAIAQAETRLDQLRKDINEEVLKLRENKVEKIRQEASARIAELEALRGLVPTEELEAELARVNELRDKQIANATRAERAKAKAAEEAAARQVAANDKVATSLELQIGAFNRTAREQAIATAVARLNAEATEAQVTETRRLAGELFDLGEAQEASNARTEAANQIFEETRTPLEKYNAELGKTRQLLEAGAISQETFARKAEDLREELVQNDETLREIKDTSEDVAGAFGDFFTSIADGSATARGALAALEESLIRIGLQLGQQQLEGLLLQGAGSLFGGFGGGTPGVDAAFGAADAGGSALDVGIAFGAGVGHKGGVAGQLETMRQVPAAVFAGAPRLHDGSIPGLRANELAAVLERGEVVLSNEQLRRMRQGGERPAERAISIAGPLVQVSAPDAGSLGRFTRDQLAAQVLAALRASERIQ